MIASILLLVALAPPKIDPTHAIVGFWLVTSPPVNPHFKNDDTYSFFPSGKFEMQSIVTSTSSVDGDDNWPPGEFHESGTYRVNGGTVELSISTIVSWDSSGFHSDKVSRLVRLKITWLNRDRFTTVFPVSGERVSLVRVGPEFR